MQVSKILVALTVAAGFASASFAQGTAAPAPQAAPAAKMAAPTPAVAEKKVEAPKAAEPVKAEAKVEAAKPEAGTPVEKHGKAQKHSHKMEKKEAVVPAAAPATK